MTIPLKTEWVDELQTLRRVSADLLAALKFARSVILAGEPWTETCHEVIDGALARAEARRDYGPGPLDEVVMKASELSERSLRPSGRIHGNGMLNSRGRRPDLTKENWSRSR